MSYVVNKYCVCSVGKQTCIDGFDDGMVYSGTGKCLLTTSRMIVLCKSTDSQGL